MSRNYKPPRMASVATLVKLAKQGEDGRYWYDVAYANCARAARTLRVETDRFTAVLAVTSPRVHVRRNIAITLAYLQEGTLDGVLPNSKRAVKQVERNLGTGRRSYDLLLGTGPKVSAFGRAILGDPDAVVLDVWMARAFGLPTTKSSNPWGTKGAYRKGAERVRVAAEQLGWTPREVQAAVWTAAYRNHYQNGNPPPLEIVL